ncbi:MAG: dihydroxyacetone kinase subunit DhaK [Bowdeniella nasicola]|nr:dihydroxyacetone kinase subunit DhaK [Bowdeniella nasicola]
MKKLINDPADLVREYAEGLALAYPDLVAVHADPLFMTRAHAPTEPQVAVISGGGAGHEPLHAGFVGPGLLDAAISGPVFTSPPPQPIYEAARAVEQGRGVLLIVKNYTGDVMNFETAAELLEMDGIEVRMVVVNDDVAVQDSTYTAGRRGVAGTLVVEKVAGAAAAAGADLTEVARLAQRTADRVHTMGVALRAGVHPGLGGPSFDLPDSQIEVGIGIHGEPGRRRERMEPADAVVDMILAPVLAETTGPEVLLLVNGMGGTAEAELYICLRRAYAQVEAAGLRVIDTLVGNYVTSLDMQGVSLTLASLDEELQPLWSAPCRSAALTRAGQ